MDDVSRDSAAKVLDHIATGLKGIKDAKDDLGDLAGKSWIQFGSKDLEGGTLDDESDKASAEEGRQRWQAELAASQQIKALHDEMAQQELADLKVGIAAAQEGSQRKIDLLREERALVVQLNTESGDKLENIDKEIAAAERARLNQRKTQLQELVDFAETLDTRAVAQHAATQLKLVDLDLRRTKEEEKQLEELVNFAQDLDTRVTNQHIAANQKEIELNKRVAQEYERQWQGVFSAVGSSLSSSISGMIEGTMNFKQAMLDLSKSVLDAFVRMGVDMLVNWGLNQLGMMALSKTTSAANVSASAAQAGAAGVASWAGAPWPIDAGAPGFGEAMFEEAMAYNFASASQGYDIPAGVDPVTQLHAQEMVLPAELANTVRGMAGGGGGGRGAPVHIHGRPSDNITVESLVGMLKEANMRFMLNGVAG